MHTEGINAGEMKHGPLALVDDKMPILVVATMDSMHAKMQGVIEQLMARKARLLVLCCDEDEDMVDLVGGKYPLIQVCIHLLRFPAPVFHPMLHCVHSFTLPSSASCMHQCLLAADQPPAPPTCSPCPAGAPRG